MFNKIEVFLGSVIAPFHLWDCLYALVGHEGRYLGARRRQQRGRCGGAHSLEVTESRHRRLDVGQLLESLFRLLHHRSRCVHFYEV